MKKTILFGLLAIIAGGCGNKSSKTAEQTLRESDTTYTSDIRPNEQLELEKTYTDTFEYVDYNDEGDDSSIIVKKDGKTHALINNFLIPQIIFDLNLNCGDRLEIEWKIDSLIPAGDSEALWLVEYAEKITKIENLSRARAQLEGDLKNFEIHKLNDTIVQDLNGDNMAEKIYFNESKYLIIVDGKENIETTFDDFVFSEFDWVDFWGVATDSETWRMTFKENGDINGSETVPLLFPSIFVRKYESGGGIITFDKEKYVWIHQND